MTRGVFPKRLTKLEAQAIVAATLQRLCLAHGKDRVALEAGCDERTIRDARDGDKSMLSMHLLANLLTLDGSALDEIAAHFGFQIVPLGGHENSDAQLLADVVGLGAELAASLAATGGVNHVAEQAIAKRARVVVRELAGRIAVADRKRASR